MYKAKIIHNNLEKEIDHIVSQREKYVRNPKTDFVRNRKLPMQSVIRKILAMEGGSLQKELYRFSCMEKIELTPSAFVQQRSKISSKVFVDLFHSFNNSCRDLKVYKGYRLFAIDGSKVDRSRDPNSDSFMRTSKYPEGFNQIHLNAIYDLCNKTYFDVHLQPSPKQDEHKALQIMVQRNEFCGKNILIADRGYESYNIIARLTETPNLEFLFRARHGSGAFRSIRELPMCELDEDITVEITTTQTNEDKARNRVHIPQKSKKKTNSPNTNIRPWDFASPYTLKFRAVRFLLESGQYETIITSLRREQFSINEIKELYHMRWGIETSFCELKYAIGLINLHCKKEELIEQEIYASLIMYNYFSRIAGSVPIDNRKGAIYEYKVNFTMAVHICRKFYREGILNFKKLIFDISKYTEPIRPGRSDKRNIKCKGFIGFTYRVAA